MNEVSMKRVNRGVIPLNISIGKFNTVLKDIVHVLSWKIYVFGRFSFIHKIV